MNISAIQEIAFCTKCDLCKSRTMPVPGAGSLDADILFLGEAPGSSEDLHGRPFVGAAGRRLDEALEGAGLTRDAVYITNVVKCRPPDNRKPTESEQDACRAYLDREISVVDPKVICIMGNTAYGAMLGGTNITRDRGRFVDRDGRRYFLTVHPAATIYNPKLIDVLNSDIAKLAKMIKP